MSLALFPRLDDRPRPPGRAAVVSAAGSGPPRHVGDLAGRLTAEWEVLSSSPAAAAAAAAWGRTCPALSGAGSPEALRAGLPALDPAGRDAVLLALLELAQAGD